MKLKFFILPVVFLFNAGCAYLNVPINSYSGKVQNGIYTNAVGKSAGAATFSIAIPQASESLEYTYLQIQDQMNSSNTSALFGPALHDFSRYGVSVFNNDSVMGSKDINQQKDNLMNYEAGTFSVPVDENNSGSSPLLPSMIIYQKDFLYKNWPARYIVYKFPFPADVGNGMTTVTDAELIVIYPQYSAILSMLAVDSGKEDSRAINQINDSNRSQVVNMTLPVLVNYYNSFVINS